MNHQCEGRVRARPKRSEKCGQKREPLTDSELYRYLCVFFFLGLIMGVVLCLCVSTY